MFTHTALLVTCCAAGLWAFLRIVDRGGLQDYLLFGTILGLGGLAKYSFLVFLGCLFAAAAMQPILRQRLWRPGMLLSIGTGLVIVGPYLLWFLREGWDLSGTYRQLMFPPGTGGWTARALAALRTLPKSIVAFSSPLLPVSALLFPAAFHPRLPPDPPPATSGGPDLVRLVRDMLLVAVSLLSLGALAGAVDRYRERWMHPFLLVVPIYLVARIRRARPSRRQVRLFIAALLLFPLVALGFRGGQLILGPLLCGWPCRDRTPFDQLAARLAEAGFRGGTIVAPDMYTGANLRAHFPRSRVIALGHPFFDPPPSVAPGQCLIVWTLDARGLHPPPKALEYAGLAGDGAHPREPVRRASIPWRLRFAGDRDLITTWAYLLIPEGAGRCS